MAKILRTTSRETTHKLVISQGEVDWLCLCDCGGGLVPKQYLLVGSLRHIVYIY